MKLYTTSLGPVIAICLSFAIGTNGNSDNTCTESNTVKRQEWSALTLDQRSNYINSVNCLISLPSRYEDGVLSASTSYFADFTAVHVLQAGNIHTSGIFLSWHRHFRESHLKDILWYHV